jgi:molybdopterin/thiamine biosynthesis adenylyltransferase
MPKNKIEDLRNHLFATIESLLDQDQPMDIERARVVAEVANAVINSAKVEVSYMKLTGNNGTNFIPDDKTIELR